MKQGSIVSVFGGSAALPGEKDYEAAEEVGRLLAQAGFITMTGGFNGIMEAASKGAREAGGHVIGVTFNLVKEGETNFGPNPYVVEHIEYDELSPRLLHLIKKADAIVTMPGGLGTLSEVTLAWSLIQTHEIPPIPLIVYGQEWADLFTQFSKMYGAKQYVNGNTMGLWRIAYSPEQVIGLLQD